MAKKGKAIEIREVVLKGFSSSPKVDQDGGMRRVTKLTFDFEGQDEESMALLPLQRSVVLKLTIEPMQKKLGEGGGDDAGEG